MADKKQKPRVTWHTAFFDAIRLELEAYMQGLTFIFELPLIAEPLRIDTVIIKKPDVEIHKPIGRIFRQYNIIEYKSPEDILSLWHFHKVISYAHQYMYQNKRLMTDITVSFVVSHRPKRLIKQLRTSYTYKVTQEYAGIYSVVGYAIPIQIAVCPELPEEEDLWLKRLNTGLDLTGMRKVIEAGKAKAKSPYIKAYLYQICQANPELLREVMLMKRVTADQVLEEIGWSEERRAEGRAEGNVKCKREILDLINQVGSLEELRERLRTSLEETQA